MLYVSLRDAYERLYRYESLRREANVPVSYTHLDVYKRQPLQKGQTNPKDARQQQQQEKPQKKTGKGMKM